MEKSLRILITFFILLTLIMFSCRKEFEFEKNPITEQISIGNLIMPQGSPIDPSTINIISLSETASPDQDGNFLINAPDIYYSYFYAEDQNGNTIGMSYQYPGDGIIINDTSTALSLVMIFPVNWGQFGINHPSKIINEIKSSPQYNTLVSYVHNIMINKPSELMDYEKHPAILNTAANIIKSIADKHDGISKQKNFPTLDLKSENEELVIEGWGPEVKDIPNNPRIEIINPTGTPYGISSFNINKDPKKSDSYGLSKIPFYVDSWGLNWWIIYKKGKVEYNLGDGSFIVMLSRIDPLFFTGIGNVKTLADIFTSGKDLTNGDYMEVLKTNARAKALLGTVLDVTARALGIVSVADPTEATGFIEIAIENGPSALDLVADLTLGAAEPIGRTKEELIKWMVKLIKDNQKAIIKWAKNHGVKIGSKAFQKSIENITIVLDCASALGDVAQLLTLFTDSFLAEQDVVYSITQSDGNAVIKESRPPTAPVITGSQRCITNQKYIYNVMATDPEGDKIKYQIHYGDGTSSTSPLLASGTAYSFEHNWATGNYEILALAEDEEGATSVLSDPLKVTVAPEDDFIETFESYSLGDMVNDEIWRINYAEPSRITISSAAYKGSKAAKFVDYDPLIGDNQAKYASLYTSLSKNLQSIELFFRFDDDQDIFGFRAWESIGNFSKMAYYIIIDQGTIKWVKEGKDIENETDFIPLESVNSGKWYRLKLVVNWDNSTYDVYLDNTLLKSSADFVAKGRGSSITQAPELQFVAFTTTNCRSFYVDNLYIKGAQARNLEFNKTKSLENSSFVESQKVVSD